MEEPEREGTLDLGPRDQGNLRSGSHDQEAGPEWLPQHEARLRQSSLSTCPVLTYQVCLPATGIITILPTYFRQGEVGWIVDGPDGNREIRN